MNTEINRNPTFLTEREPTGDFSAVSNHFTDDGRAQDIYDRFQAGRDALDEEQAWTEVITSFIKSMDSSGNEDVARGLLSRLVGQSYRAQKARGGTVEDFSLGLLSVLGHLDHIPGSLMSPNVKDTLKRQPSFFESAMATLKRYKLMEDLPTIFDGVARGIIVGGSMSYGPFYNVRDGATQGDPSDVDSLVILDDDWQSKERWHNMLRSEQLDPDGKACLLGRLPIFEQLQKEGRGEVISQRFDVPGHNFNMSTHFMTHSFFERMNGQRLREDVAAGEDTVFVVRDYKPRPFEHPVCAQRSFDGTVYPYQTPVQKRVGDDGFIAETPGYIIDNGKFYPGLYQNLISPEFDVLYDGDGQTQQVVTMFQETVQEYVVKERRQGHLAELALSHIRGDFFAPGRYGIPAQSNAGARTIG